MLWCEVLDELMIIIMLAWGGMGNICCISGGLKGFSFQPSVLKEKRSAPADCALLIAAGGFSALVVSCDNDMVVLGITRRGWLFASSNFRGSKTLESVHISDGM